MGVVYLKFVFFFNILVQTTPLPFNA